MTRSGQSKKTSLLCRVLKNGSYKLRCRTGFIKAVQLVLRVKEGGCVTAGPPCSSFIVLNMGTSGRSSTRPLGHSWRPYVVQANL